jgi:CRP-like cAMP-binding protein
VSIEDDIVFIERVPTLQMLGREALRILAIGAESRYVHKGEVLFVAGDVADCGYVVQEGSFRLETTSNLTPDVIVGPGTLLGELALIAETKRPATATANEPSTVIRISRSLFLKMLEGYPQAAHVLRDQIVARAEQALADISDIRALLDTSQTPPE